MEEIPVENKWYGQQLQDAAQEIPEIPAAVSERRC